MAVFSSILCPSKNGNVKVAALASATASSVITLGTDKIFAINATQDITISFGSSTMADATASDFRIPANQMLTLDLGRDFDSLSVYNLGASAADVYIQNLSKF